MTDRASLRCVREHRLVGNNVQLRPCGRLRCLECHREGTRLAQRVLRLVRTVERHRRLHPACPGQRRCEQLRLLLDRLKARERALKAWRKLGKPLPARRSHASA